MTRHSLSETSLELVHSNIQRHRLPIDFIHTVTEFYTPLCHQIRRRLISDRCNFIGIQGSQGSGKSTCADFVKTILENEFKLRVLVASIDDFYLSLAERQALAKATHPLLLTRGVPGTHDVDRIAQLFENANSDRPFSVPSFSKAKDDQIDPANWPGYQGPFDVVILEGWCVGIPAQDSAAIKAPVNSFEKTEDTESKWRSFANQALAKEYQAIFQKFDTLISLQAPSFDCVYNWRALQEQKLIAKLEENGQDTSATMNTVELNRFISHYERLTEHALKVLPKIADLVLYLNKEHGFTKMTINRN